MFRKLILLVLITGVFQVAYGQVDTGAKEKSRKGRPDIPGTFLIDFGLNFPTNDTVGFNTGVWGSRTINIYYQLDKRIGQSKISIHPGLGFGLERYKFNNDYTLTYNQNNNLEMVPVTSLLGNVSAIKKSQLITNYFDATLEFRFSTNPNDPARSFKTSLGFKAGYLFDSFTKIKYREDGETKKLKDKQNWNLSQFRYGPYLRLGVGSFSIFGYYSLSPIFEKGKGPGQAEINTLTAGISLAAF